MAFLRSLVQFMAATILMASLCSPLQMAAQVRIPFVGCLSDGQQGPLKAPRRASKVLPITPQTAQKVAYYQAENGVGVLAPRGWHCFGTYGSSGDSLYVSPQPINAAALFSQNWRGFSGSAIQISRSYGGTSGRFEVARVIARVFPDHKEFVQNVIQEGIETDFPFGPYPNDRLRYKSKNVVEYQTPGLTDGLGTASRLLNNASPIGGVAILVGEDLDLIHLSVRLPAESAFLTPVIIQEVERGATQRR